MIFLELVLSIISGFSTFYIMRKFRISPTRSSAIISILGFAIFYFIRELRSFDISYYSALVFGASFVGMTSFKILNYVQVTFSTCFFAVLYVFFIPKLEGIGGALGFSAFLSVFFTYAVNSIQKRFK